MIRIVYSDKVEGQIEVDTNSVTYYRDDLFCKEFKDEETAEKFVEYIETKPTSKTALTEFLTKMEVVCTKDDTTTTLKIKADTYLTTSTYTWPKEKVEEPIIKPIDIKTK